MHSRQGAAPLPAPHLRHERLEELRPQPHVEPRHADREEPAPHAREHSAPKRHPQQLQGCLPKEAGIGINGSVVYDLACTMVDVH